LIRPVQVKGKFPETGANERPTYGYRGDLTLVHEGMVLAIVFFELGSTGNAPRHVAWMPWGKVRKAANGQYFCLPARRDVDGVKPRRDSRQYFDHLGLQAMT